MNAPRGVNDGLAQEADHDARVAIVTFCPVVSSAGHVWHDMEGTRPDVLDHVTNALEWIRARGDDLVGYRAVFHPVYPSLIRFDRTDAEEAPR